MKQRLKMIPPLRIMMCQAQIAHATTKISLMAFQVNEVIVSRIVRPIEISIETNRNINSDPSVAKLRTQVRETAGLVRDATYHVTNIDCLKEAMEALKKIHHSLMCNSLREGSLPIRSSPPKKRLKVTSLDYHKVFHKKLPLRRKRKIRVKSPQKKTRRPRTYLW